MTRTLTNDGVVLTVRVAAATGPAAALGVAYLDANRYARVEGSDTDWVGVVAVTDLSDAVAGVYALRGRPLRVVRIEPLACAAGKCGHDIASADCGDGNAE